MKTFFLKHYVHLLLSLALLIFVFIYFLCFLQIKHSIVVTEWVFHSHHVIEAVDETIQNIFQAETKQRGYLLTGNKKLIDSYIENVNQTKNSIAKLNHLTKDNSTQQTNIKILESLLTQRLGLLQQVLQVREIRGLPAAIRIIEAGEGEKISDKIDKIGLIITNTEKKLLSKRNADRLVARYRTFKLLIFGNSVTLILFLLCFYFLKKELNIRHSVEKKMKKTEDDLLRLAYFDPLTGIANRSQFIDRFESLVIDVKNTDEYVALLFLDLDNFKNVNDSLGHEVGDNLLRIIAIHLNTLLGERNFLFRLGGDEFLIIARAKEFEQLHGIAKNILESLKESFFVSEHRIYISASIGVSVYPLHGEDMQTLLKNADIAMYRAKESGRNNYQFCTVEIKEQVERRNWLDYHMRKAILDEEFVLHYQPKFNLKNNEISGAEVLLRWENPKLGLIFPADFISLAESNGLIIPIGEWMLKSVCKQGIKWREEGLPFDMAVNFSIRQFNAVDFIKKIELILTETNYDPNFLEFEITENILMDNSAKNIAAIKALRDMGIKITIDDFGTKYASLSYLRHFAIDKLKIDRSFITEIKAGNADVSIIKAIIVMAHSLGIKVVAEGVETQLQVDFLKEHGCDEAQGFYYSQSLPAEMLTSFVANTSQRYPFF